VDVLDCGAGHDVAFVQREDARTTRNCETVHVYDGTPHWGRTLTGTPGDDTLVGTERGDVIRAGDGDDTVDGRSGDDVLWLARGRDVATAGPGNDVVNARADDGVTDEIDCGEGHDVAFVRADDTVENCEIVHVVGGAAKDAAA
jgi:Ca2+-binding RTX toxin-like protein